MKKKYQQTLLCTLLLLTAWGLQSQANIIQESGETYIAFEAENFDTSGSYLSGANTIQWLQQEDAEASGGLTMRADFGALVSSQLNDNDAYLTYNLTFAEAGTYYLYYRIKSDDAAQNSAHYAKSFDVDPTGADFNNLGGAVTNGYHWEFFNQYTTTYTIAEPDTTVVFSVKVREYDFEFDRFVLSTSKTLLATDETILDGLANSPIPEPGTISLLILGAAIPLLRRYIRR